MLLPQTPCTVNDLTYEVVVRQMPVAARASGRYPKDRRPLDPIPAVELHVFDGRTKKQVKLPHALVVKFTLFVSLVSPGIHEPIRYLPDGSTETLSGCFISSLFFVDDNQDLGSLFFAFPDLGVRCTGRFELKFMLKIDDFDLGHGEDIGAMRGAIKYSEPFDIVTGTRYNGVETATDLTRLLADWGLQCRVRCHERGQKSSKKPAVAARSKRGTHIASIPSTSSSSHSWRAASRTVIERTHRQGYTNPLPRHLRTPRHSPPTLGRLIQAPLPRYPSECSLLRRFAEPVSSVAYGAAQAEPLGHIWPVFDVDGEK